MEMLHIYFGDAGKTLLVRLKKDSGPWRWCGNVVSANVHEGSVFVEVLDDLIHSQLSPNDNILSTADMLKASKLKSWKLFFKKFKLLVLQWDEKGKHVVQLWERTVNDAYSQPRLPGSCLSSKEELIKSTVNIILADKGCTCQPKVDT